MANSISSGGPHSEGIAPQWNSMGGKGQLPESPQRSTRYSLVHNDGIAWISSDPGLAWLFYLSSHLNLIKFRFWLSLILQLFTSAGNVISTEIKSPQDSILYTFSPLLLHSNCNAGDMTTKARTTNEDHALLKHPCTCQVNMSNLFARYVTSTK